MRKFKAKIILENGDIFKSKKPQTKKRILEELSDEIYRHFERSDNRFSCELFLEKV